MLSTLISISGLLLSYRLISGKQIKKLFTKAARTLMFMATLLFIMLINTLFYSSDFIAWSLILFFVSFLTIVPKIRLYHLDKVFQNHTIILLDEVILNIQAGNSFRSSLVKTANNQNGIVKVCFLEICNSIAFPSFIESINFPSLSFLRQKFQEIDNSHSKILEQLRFLRKNLKIEDNFRRRSGKISLQTQSQSIILSFLQLGLTFFVISHFGIEPCLRFIVTSYILFGIAIVWIFFLGRNPKWDI